MKDVRRGARYLPHRSDFNNLSFHLPPPMHPPLILLLWITFLPGNVAAEIRRGGRPEGGRPKEPMKTGETQRMKES